MIRLFFLCALLTLSFPLASYSERPFTPNGSYTLRLHPKQIQPSTRSKMARSPSKKEAAPEFVQVQKLIISPEARQLIAGHIQQALQKGAADDAVPEALNPEKVFLGMNDVPVLKQGPWNSCVTFAVTAAIDALYSFNPSNQVSQLCNLELGMFLQTSGIYGGWEYSSAREVLEQISTYGYLTMGYQKKHGCGGLTKYPLTEDTIGIGMTVMDFEEKAKHRLKPSQWHEILVPALSNDALASYLSQSEVTLKQLRAVIRRGHRIAMGFRLPVSLDYLGASSVYHDHHDIWMLTDDVLQAASEGEWGGHVVVVTGFDDGCIPVSVDGEEQQVCGYVIFRNSWGAENGDNGDFYMTYEYLNALADDMYEIG